VKRLGYRPALDGVRGLAITAVVAFHAFGWPTGGYLGVDLFFVLSGFLITTLLLEERRERGSASLLAFYKRRALRLLPALVVMLVAVLAVALIRAAVTGDADGLGRTFFVGAAGLGYATNFLLASSDNRLPVLGHLWSLATEEQFYVLWPPLLLVVLRGRRGLSLGVLGAALAVILYRQVELVRLGAPGHRLDFAPDTRGSSILIGCFVAVAAQGGVPLRAVRLRSWPLLLVGLLLLLDQGRRLFEGPLLLFGVAAGLVILRALEPSTLEHRLLTRRPLVELGRLSYSLYLWHVPVLVWLGVIGHGLPGQNGLGRQLVGVALSLLAAVLSYRLVEQPFLRRKRRLGGARPALAYGPKSLVLRATVLSNSART
jgi:peptidoglycan/LPS O-acetylase OafA/YrhL